jgi:uracil-DNA glycosylase
VSAIFDVNCRRCTRLSRFLDQIKSEHPEYYCRPVPPFGDPRASLVIVGLAPGMHGANRTGRPFTGDHAGILLYRTLFKYGFANRDHSSSADDALRLHDARITNSVKCLPPENKPTPLEITTCNDYLHRELAELAGARVLIALGAVAHLAIMKARQLRAAQFKFAHAAEHSLPGGLKLIDSYHCSRYNTQTRRLTTPMFESIFARARSLLQ